VRDVVLKPALVFEEDLQQMSLSLMDAFKSKEGFFSHFFLKCG
jgi:hypothetical protein